VYECVSTLLIPRTAQVTGDSGSTYTATAAGYCECPDAANGKVCEHQFAVKIACQMAAVARAEETHFPQPR